MMCRHNTMPLVQAIRAVQLVTFLFYQESQHRTLNSLTLTKRCDNDFARLLTLICVSLTFLFCATEGEKNDATAS